MDITFLDKIKFDTIKSKAYLKREKVEDKNYVKNNFSTIFTNMGISIVELEKKFSQFTQLKDFERLNPMVFYCTQDHSNYDTEDIKSYHDDYKNYSVSSNEDNFYKFLEDCFVYTIRFIYPELED